MKVFGVIMKSTSTRLPTRAGRGSGGGWLKVGEVMWLKSAAAKDFADNASPGRFLWFVSCADTRNEHITVFWGRTTRSINTNLSIRIAESPLPVAGSGLASTLVYSVSAEFIRFRYSAEIM